MHERVIGLFIIRFEGGVMWNWGISTKLVHYQFFFTRNAIWSEPLMRQPQEFWTRAVLILALFLMGLLVSWSTKRSVRLKTTSALLAVTCTCTSSRRMCRSRIVWAK